MSNNMQTLALSVPHSGSIEGYVQAVSSIDMLTAEKVWHRVCVMKAILRQRDSW